MHPDDTLYLIDGHAIIYRCFYAIPPLTNKKGLNTNAIYGFLRQLIGFIEMFKCKYLGVVFDPPGETFHHGESDAYKAHRTPMPGELALQIPWIYKCVEKMGIKRFEVPGWEADDVIGTIAVKSRDTGKKVVIFSTDKDLFQLVDDKISIYRFRQGLRTPEWITPEKVAKRYHGITPEQMIDFLALMGDQSDNVPGVPGIGEKTAAKLLNEYKTIDNLKKYLRKLPGKKLKENLSSHWDDLLLSKKLVTMHTNLPVDFDSEDFIVQWPPGRAAVEVLKELEFYSIIKDLNIKTAPQKPPEPSKPLKTVTITDAEQSSRQPPPPAKRFAVWCSTEKISIYINDGNIYNTSLTQKKSIDLFLKKCFEPGTRIITWNLKEFLHTFKNIKFQSNFFDVRLAVYLLSPGEDISFDESIKKYSIGSISHAVAALDELEKVLMKKLKDLNMLELYYDIEIPLRHILAEMETTGVLCDVNFMKGYRGKLQKVLKNIEDEIYREAGHSFNIQSSKQLQVVLFDEMNMPRGRKTKTGHSTDSGVLEYLSVYYDLPAKVLEYRHLNKLLNTYVDVLPGMVNKKTKRINTTWHQTVTATGRLSSSEPNLQNIPIRSPVGREIRNFFIAGKDNYLLSADYSQIELRILAHLSKDEGLREVFITGQDIHTATAASIMNCINNEVTEAKRRFAKTINFGIIYGLSTYGLARALGIELSDAKKFIEDYHAQYPGIKRYQERVLEFVRAEGYVFTLAGRRRYLPDILSEYARTRQGAERIAINTPVQGAAADLIKIAMVNIHRKLISNKFNSRMIAQVHDELLLEVPVKELDDARELVRYEMETALKLSVPLKVVIQHGKNWHEAHG